MIEDDPWFRFTCSGSEAYATGGNLDPWISLDALFVALVASSMLNKM